MRAALAAERVKARKSWHLLTALLCPLCQAGLLALLCWYSADRVRVFRPGFRFWLDLNFVAWNLALMPVLAALVCDLAWDLEREADPQGVRAAQPVSARDRYLAKALVNLGLLTGGTLLLALLVPALGLLLRRHPDLLMGPFPAALAGRHLAWSLLAPPAVVAFQTGLSRARGGSWPALGAALLGLGLSHRLVGATPLVALLPWGLAARADLAFERWRVLPWAWAPLSLAVAVTLALLGAAWEARRRDART
jgi:hypothetical protein